MTANELTLINLVRDSENPEQALNIAVSVILDFLKQHGSSEEQVVACPREPS